MVLADVGIGRYGYLMDGTLFKVPDNPLNRSTDHDEMVIVLYPGTVAAHDRRYPPGTPCKDAPNWNN